MFRIRMLLWLIILSLIVSADICSIMVRGNEISGENLVVRTDRMRKNLSRWKKEIAVYSKKHYGENTWKLKPTVIVLHYTALPDFPWVLVNSKSCEGEKPGLASHYVVDERNIWRILPDNVRSRGAYGINHRAINIEMMALNAGDLAKKKNTLLNCARLVKYLMDKYDIPMNKIYSHEQVSKMDRRTVPEVKDLVNPTPYDKYDPGEKNMKRIRDMIRKMDSF